MATSIDTKAYLIGGAEVYYRATGVLTPWTNVGVTLDDAALRITSTWFRPDNLTGVRGPVRGLDVLSECNAEFEFTMPELAGEKLGLAVPGAIYTAGTGTVKSSGHLDSTLSAATVAGVTTISVASATNATVGDAMKIGTGATAEWRTITAISTNDLSFRDPLIFAHASSEVVEEADDDNRSVVTGPTVARQPNTAYREWAIVAQSGKSNVHELRLPIAISQTESAEVTLGDEVLSGIRVIVSGRLDEAALTTSSWRLYAPMS